MIEALEECGAIVLKNKSFGSYQGDCIAKVEYLGIVGWVVDSYGSCALCDHLTWLAEALESEEIGQREYDMKIKAYGIELLEDMRTQEEIELYVKKYQDWDMESEEMLKFVTARD